MNAATKSAARAALIAAAGGPRALQVAMDDEGRPFFRFEGIPEN
ncbi:hypothetical protein [Sphingomonas parva]|nr:hypothetical protein [Sphingomonas parva]